MRARANPTARNGEATDKSEHGAALDSYPLVDDGNLTAQDFLKYLPPGTNAYHYQSIEDVAKVIEKEYDQWMIQGTGSPYIIIFNFPKERLHDQTPAPISKHFSAYHARLHILLLKMISKAHGEATQRFSVLITNRVAAMDLEYDLLNFGNAEVQGHTRSKSADCAFRPVTLPPGRSQVWPTLVAEIGFSESAAQLEADVAWWLSNSNGDVRVAVTIDIRRRNMKTIIFESWELMPGAQTRANPIRCVPQRTARVTVERADEHATQNENISVHGGPMTLMFQKIFLRDPTGPEGDIVISQDDFRNLARMVWLSSES